jgi:hypothetical protein
MNKLIDIFCDVDDFCHQFLPVWEAELIANAKGVQVLSFERSDEVKRACVFHS